MDGHHHKLLKELTKDNKLSQRELSKRLRLSLGRVNYVVSNLVDAGLIRAKRFKNSKNKMAYMYILTPSGTLMNGHHLKLLKELLENNSQSQRELSRKLGPSLLSHPDPFRDKK